MSVVRVLLVGVLVLPFAHALPIDLPFEPQPPRADFMFTDPLPREPVTLTSTSTDRDSVIILLEWTIEAAEGEVVPVTGEQIEHTFAKPGEYVVTLTATNALLFQSTVAKTLSVPNTPPIALINDTLFAAFRGKEVPFEDVSIDEDGDEIVESEWQTEGIVLYGRNVSHAYTVLGAHDVQLKVRDARGADSFAYWRVRILNHPPSVSASFSPSGPAVGETVTFEATGTDPDSNGPITFLWRFSDGVSLSGQTVARSFETAGELWFSLHGRDVEGAHSAPSLGTIRVR